jgi:hypothetical protein
MMSGDHGDLPEKIIDSMIDIVHEKEESEKKRRKLIIERRVKDMIKKAEEEIHARYSAKVDTLEIIKIHMKKEEREEAAILLRGFYLTRKLKRRRARAPKKDEPEEVEEAVVEALEEQPTMDVFQELADLMSISEEEAKMYSLELAEGFRKATKRKITAEKAAECYLQFRNWDFKNTWLKTIKGRK